MDYLNKKFKIIYSFVLSAIVSVVFIVFITIAGEEYKPIKKWLANVFTHHWIGKSMVAVILFVFIAIAGNILPLQPKNKCVISILWILFATMMIGAVLIGGYFVLHWYGLT